LADQLLHLRNVLGAATGGGHEGAYADVDAQATFYGLDYRAGNGGLIGKRRQQSGPILRTFHSDGGKFVVAFVVRALYHYRDDVALFDVRDSAVAKLRER